ncbi:hypothetical protein WN943_027719 [Citrus x changshan-huyou]
MPAPIFLFDSVSFLCGVDEGRVLGSCFGILFPKNSEGSSFPSSAWVPVMVPSSRLHTRIIMLQILCFATSKLNPGCLFKCRSSDDHGKLAIIYKSEKRNEMVQEGYRILGNSGDQWSDLLGSPMPSRSFKLPNPMYYIP